MDEESRQAEFAAWIKDAVAMSELKGGNHHR